MDEGRPDSSRSSGSDSSDASGSSCATSSSGGGDSRGGSPDASPQRQAAPAPPIRRLVPMLSLGGANLADLPRQSGPGDAPSTARGTSRLPAPPASARGPPKVPALALPKAAAAAAAAPPPRLAPPPPAASAQAPLSLDMLSPAFVLERPAAAAAAEEAGRTAAARLGVPPERLRFYALTPVAGPQVLPPGCTRAAVEVQDSRFSLAAVEQLLGENQRLAAAAAQQTPAAASPADQELRALREKLAQAQLEGEALRQRLQRSESLRRKGQKALFELNQDFTALSRELMQNHGMKALGPFKAPQSPPASAAAREPRGAGERMGTPAAVDDGCLLQEA